MTLVLIVEDNIESSYLLEVILKGTGYSVIGAENGAEALEKARAHRPNIVISDLLMPVMDGYTLLAHWRSDPELAPTPIIIYTATYVDEEDEALAIELGADAFIKKPSEAEILLEAIGEILATGRRGSRTSRSSLPANETRLLAQYNKTLIRKLEQKTHALEKANRDLNARVAEREQAAAVQTAVLDAIEARIALLDVDGTILAVNQSWRAADGSEQSLQRGVEIGSNYLDVCDGITGPDQASAARVASAVRSVLSASARHATEEYALGAGATERWFRMSASPVDFGRGGAVVMHFETTDMRLADLRNRAATKRLELAVESASIGVWEWDLNSGETVWDDRMYRIYGVPAGTPIDHRQWLARVHPDNRAGQDAAMAAARDTVGSSRSREFRIVRPDGGTRHLFAAEQTLGVAGKPASVVGINWDVTSLRTAEAHNREMQERLETLVHEAAVGILVHVDFKPVMANDQLARMLGYRDKEEVIALDDCTFLFSDSEVSRLLAYNRDRRAGAEAPSFYSVVGRKRDGKEILLESRAFTISWGKDLAVCAMLTDVTEQRAIEAQLRQSQKLEVVGQLTGGVAHDFNNLLTVILGNADLLRNELHDNDRLQSVAELIQQAAERGASLTNQLLSFSRRQAIDPKASDINLLLSDMLLMLQRTLGEHIVIDLSLGEGLKPILVDRAQIESSVLNLCINARDATPEGGRIVIRTMADRGNDGLARISQQPRSEERVVIEIADNGIGMDRETMERAFEPFFTTKQPGRGTGLGLSSVYGFATQSGGQVHLESELGRGTKVRLLLPAAAASEATEAGARPATIVEQGNERILLVEDDVMVREHVTGMLSRLGYHVTTADSGPAALELLASNANIDLLFTDVVMPGGMSGIELAALSRKMRPDIRVLLTSGYVERTPAVQEAGELGCDIIWKPYRRSELSARIRGVLNSGLEQ
jgi:PAS domain S-box-containing protein